jgi:hypothetical protein
MLIIHTGYSAVTQIFRVINEQSQPSFDANFNRISYYNWTGGNGALSPAVTNQGNGEPKAYTGVCFPPFTLLDLSIRIRKMNM